MFTLTYFLHFLKKVVQSLYVLKMSLALFMCPVILTYLRFQLPIVNRGLKILNGKFQKHASHQLYVAHRAERCGEISAPCCVLPGTFVTPATRRVPPAIPPPPTSHSVATWVIGSTVTVSQCVHRATLTLLPNGFQVQSSDAGNSIH